MPLDDLKRIISVNTASAIAYFTTPNSDRRIGFRAYNDMLEEKFRYRRPEFLHLSEESEQVSADHEIRPILIPRRELPLDAGYAETINAGKTHHKNEDQAVAGMCCLNVDQSDNDKGDQGSPTHVTQTKIPFAYFGVFDGHAGAGASLMSCNVLHLHINDKLTLMKELLALETDENLQEAPYLSEASVSSITIDQLVIGALEEAFFEVDEQIRRERLTYKVDGGCTVLISIFIGKKLYVANAGDSRAILCLNGKPVPMSTDFTPETERQRLQQVAYQRPQLLGSEFGRLEYQQRARKKHIGQLLLYRDRHMTGWAMRSITEEDTKKFPMISGEGKRARLLDTIGTTRGFGDHDLKVAYCGLSIKPFLSPQPEVRVFDLSKCEATDEDVLIMASDGLWERVTNTAAVEIVKETLQKVSKEDKRRYVMAAQALVSSARGVSTLDKGWRQSNGELASYDDISVFVIPLKNSDLERTTREYDTPAVRPLQSADAGED